MIIVRAVSGDPFAAEIENELREMSVAFKVQPETQAGETHLEEGGKRITGEAEIRAYLKETKRLFHQWTSFQSDACDTDEDGTIC